MSTFVKISAKNCLSCYFYDSCIVEGVGVDIGESCEKGYVWKFKSN